MGAGAQRPLFADLFGHNARVMCPLDPGSDDFVPWKRTIARCIVEVGPKKETDHEVKPYVIVNLECRPGAVEGCLS